MAAVTVSPDHVALDPATASLGNMPTRTASEAVSPGDLVAVDASTGQVVLAQAIASPSYVKEIEGIALNAAEDGQPVKIADSGTVTLSNVACMTAGVVYCLSPGNPGQIVPHSDLTAGQLVQVLGIAINTTQVRIALNASGVSRG